MPFDCFGCVCDAADHFCVELIPGVLPPLLPDGICPDSTLFEGGCVPFPDECAQDPSCACLGNLPGACSCQKGESPVLVKCPLP